jgi:undecaprenyl-diphosphatase
VSVPPFVRTAVAADVRLSAQLQRLGDHSPRLRALAIPLARSGDGWIWIAAAALVAAGGSAEARRQALRIAVVIIATGLTVYLAKKTFRRARPIGEWGASYRRHDPHAFPSGHAARTALLAVLATTLGPWWLGLAFALWAVLVAASRVVLGVHYVSDVVGGALLGVSCGLLATLL